MKPCYKPIASESNLFEVVRQETKRDFDYPWHYHSELELTYILRGQGVRYVGNNVENFYNDDLVLLGSNLPHSWIETTDDNYSTGGIIIYLKSEFLHKNWMTSCEFDAIYQLLKLSDKGIRFDTTIAQKLKPKFLELLNLPPFEKMISLLQILQELSQTTSFYYLCEHAFTYELNETNKSRINIIYNYIQKHYLEKITLADISKQVYMSEEYFSKYFSKVMKKSFFEFLNNYKISKACKLLIETDKQVNEICYASGFESIPFFFRQFKKFKHCSPKEYRLNYKKISRLEIQYTYPSEHEITI